MDSVRINNSWAILGVLPVPVNEREEPWSERLQTRPRAQFWSSFTALGMLDYLNLGCYGHVQDLGCERYHQGGVLWFGITVCGLFRNSGEMQNIYLSCRVVEKCKTFI